MSDLMAVISTLPDPQRAYLTELFRNFPAGMESMISQRRIEAGATLTRAQDKVSHVYVLLEGRVKVLDELYSGTVYAFAEFEAPSLFGEFEAFSGCERYRATLLCLTYCRFLSISASAFLEWMRCDQAALFMRTVQITKQLVGQASNERRFRFASAENNLLLYLTEAYRKGEKHGICRLSATRQKIADETGYCVKTIQRCLTALSKQGLISTEGAKIVIDAEQCLKLAAKNEENIV